MAKDPVTLETFQTLDFRVGKVLEVQPVEGSKKLFRLSVDLGEPYGTKTILTGIQPWYTVGDLINNKYIFIANLEPKQMASVTSEGMLLCADDGQRPWIIPADDALPAGTVVR